MLSLIVNVDDANQDGLLDSFDSMGTAERRDFVRNDKLLALAIRPVIEGTSSERPLIDDHLSDDAYEVAISKRDANATDGDFDLMIGAVSGELNDIPLDISDADLTTAASTDSVAAGHGPVSEVEQISPGVYRFTWTNNGYVPPMTSPGDTLTPASAVRVSVIKAGDASTRAIQIVTIRQTPVAYAQPATQFPTADCVAAIKRPGSATANKIYTVTLTPGIYDGGFSLAVTDKLAVKKGLGIASYDHTPEELAAMFALHPSFPDGANISISRTDDVISFEFTADQGQDNAPVIEATNIDLIAPKGIRGVINLNTIPLNIAFWSTSEATLEFILAIRRTRATGEESEFLLVPVTLKRNIIDAATMVPLVFASFLTTADYGINVIRNLPGIRSTTGDAEESLDEGFDATGLADGYRISFVQIIDDVGTSVFYWLQTSAETADGETIVEALNAPSKRWLII